MLDFCAAKGIAADIEPIAISQIESAYERMYKSDVKYRFVIEAADAWGRQSRPQHPDGFSGLASMLTKIGRIEGVDAALLSALVRAGSSPKGNSREAKSRRHGMALRGQAIAPNRPARSG